MGWQQIMKLGHLHSSLIGIVRDSLKTASTAALPGVCLLCKLIFWYRHADTSMSTVLRLCISGRNAMVYLVHQWWPGSVFFFSTLVPGSGRFQLTNLLGYS